MDETSPVVKVCATFNLKLNLAELIHLRDLFGIVLPPDGSKTVSEALASIENRMITESKLWQKIASLCKEAELPVADSAPSYVVAPASPPPMGVFQLNAECSKEDAGGALEKLFDGTQENVGTKDG